MLRRGDHVFEAVPRPCNLRQLRIEGHFGFRTFWTKFCNILKYGMNLKFESIVQIFRKIVQSTFWKALTNTIEKLSKQEVKDLWHIWFIYLSAMSFAKSPSLVFSQPLLPLSASLASLSLSWPLSPLSASPALFGPLGQMRQILFNVKWGPMRSILFDVKKGQMRQILFDVKWGQMR